MAQLEPLQLPAIAKVDEIQVDTDALLAQAVTSGEDRSPGLHLSSILKGLDRHLHGEMKHGNGWNLGLCALTGFVWERIFELCYGAMLGVERPKEMERDGILLSPDGVGPDPDGKVPFCCYEQKCWWRSTKKTPMHGWYEMHQNMAYCYVMGTTVGIFDVCYLVGPMWMSGPVWKRWRIEYRPDELEKVWQMIVRNKKLGIVEK